MAKIGEAWVQCVKHTARGTHLPSGEEVLAFKEAAWKAETSALRRSLADVKASAEAREGEYWQRWAAAEAKVKALEQQQAQQPAQVGGWWRVVRWSGWAGCMLWSAPASAAAAAAAAMGSSFGIGPAAVR